MAALNRSYCLVMNVSENDKFRELNQLNRINNFEIECKISSPTSIADKLAGHFHDSDSSDGKIDKVRKYECSECLKTFTRKSHLNSHLIIHKGIKPFRCEICLTKFARMSDLRRHHKTHGGTRYVCSGTLPNNSRWGCHKSFSRKDQLRRHLKTKVAKHDCLNNVIDFYHNSNYAGSNKNKSGDLAVIENEVVNLAMQNALNGCDDELHSDNYSGNEKENDNEDGHGHDRDHDHGHDHEDEHDDESNTHRYSRGFWDTVLNRSDNTDADTSANSYAVKSVASSELFCDYCDKKFNKKSNLDSHLITHKTEKPFICELCSKSFARLSDKTRHLLTHSNFKTFQCKGILKNGSSWGCGNYYSRSDGLRKHFKSCSGSKCIAGLVNETTDPKIDHIEEALQNAKDYCGW